MIKFKGAKKIKPKQIDYLNSLSEFILDKFFTEYKKDRLDITVKFKKGLFEETDQYGNCIWMDQHYRPEEFEIEIDPDQSIQLLLNTLAHELVHVKQWAKGEFFQLQREKHVYKFCGNRFDTNKVDYWDTPWEIEAHGRAIGLVVQWTRANNLSNEDLVVEG